MTDAEITFADHMGRFYARRYSFPPMVGRLIGYLAVCDPPNPTIAELADALLASRSAISGAVSHLETIHVAQRSRVAGERMDRVRLDFSSAQSMGMDASEYVEMGQLAREGLDVLGDAPAELWVFDGNPRAEAFYRKLGFERDGVEATHHETGLHGIRMVRGR